MPSGQVIRVRREDDGVAAETLRDGIRQIQAELKVTPEFPPEVQRAADAAAGAPRLPDVDRTDIPFVTLDPPGSMDLDQAFHLDRDGDGYTVRYAIADVAAFLEPGGPVDTEANLRGQSLYGADSKIPLHPKVLSEGSASLLPDQVRPALLWTMTLDAAGAVTSTHVERARVRSVAKLDYAGVQQQLDEDSLTGPYADSVRLLRTIGELRIQQEIQRGGVSLPLPDQEVEITGDRWRLAYRTLLPAEEWNAQLSLMTGYGAAKLMLGAGIGLLRTLPPADPRDTARFKRATLALGVPWPEGMSYPDFLRSLDPTEPKHAAVLVASTRLLRGGGYLAFTGAPPEHAEHAALASPYAHVTAPLRRLVDRYAGEICVAVCAGEPVPSWVTERMPEVPDTMRRTASLAGSYERAILDLVEAGVLAPHVGERFDGVVIDLDDRDQGRGTVTVPEPAVEAPVSGPAPLPLGTDVSVRLTEADVAKRKVAFTL
ncbi:RNB domain-containing ribonuclease [Nocardioides sp.]|uniref:RNB domain-containing ribonuclease n=1 Tax=Nocardioides sp. TaxID=35761 RepID=UPI0039E593D4